MQICSVFPNKIVLWILNRIKLRVFYQNEKILILRIRKLYICGFQIKPFISTFVNFKLLMQNSSTLCELRKNWNNLYHIRDIKQFILLNRKLFSIQKIRIINKIPKILNNFKNIVFCSPQKIWELLLFFLSPKSSHFEGKK